MSNFSLLSIVAIGLVIALLLELVGIVLVLLLTERAVPSELWALVLAEVTGLLGLLAPSKDAVQPAVD